jgi:hypothetical protein
LPRWGVGGGMMEKRDLQKDLELCNLNSNIPFDCEKLGSGLRQQEVYKQFKREAEEGWPYAIKRAMEAEELLKKILGAAKFQSCSHNTDEDADVVFHCCDWGGWVEEVKQFLGE